MKFSLFLGCVVLSILVVASGHTFDSTLDEDWKNWKSEYEKQYMEEEDGYRKMIWEDNMRYIEQHNLEHAMGKHTFTVGMNQFGDLTTEEFNKLMNGFLQAEADNSTEEEVDEDDKDDESDEDEESDDVQRFRRVDWRKKGCVTPVKNQGRCGSCWAFSATGALEGQWFKKTRQLVPLSEENLVDCSGPFGNHGCKGGRVEKAFEYVIKSGGINSAASYAYTGKEGPCQFDKNKVAATCKSYRQTQRRSERRLARSVRKVGPISVAVDASHRSFRFYKRGIYYEKRCSSRKLSHAMLVVGYLTKRRRSYWIVKNSWGTKWGNRGYINMAKGRRNNCGIASRALYPVV